MEKLLIFIGGAVLLYLIYLGFQNISNEGMFLPSQIKPYYEQIKCRISGFSKESKNSISNATKEYLQNIYRDRDRQFNNTVINNCDDINFVECFVNIYIYTNLKSLSVYIESDKVLKKDLLKKSYTECKNYLNNKDNYNKELIEVLEINFDKNDEVYYG